MKMMLLHSILSASLGFVFVACTRPNEQSGEVAATGKEPALARLTSRYLIDYIRLRYCLPPTVAGIPQNIANKIDLVHLPDAIDPETLGDLSQLPNVHALYFNINKNKLNPLGANLKLPAQIQSVIADTRRFDYKDNLDGIFSNLTKDNRQVVAFTFYLKSTDKSTSLLSLADEFPSLEEIRIKVDQFENPEALRTFYLNFGIARQQLPQKFINIKKIVLEVYKSESDVYVEQLSRENPTKPFTTQYLGRLKDPEETKVF